jgi:acyl-CoA dehydrogenase
MTPRGRLDTDVEARLEALLPRFATRAPRYDASNRFVFENYADLKRARLMSLPVPQQLGGQGFELPALSAVLRRMAAACPSTALTYSMHLQTVAALVWHWRRHEAPVVSVLERVAREQIAIATSAGSDWLASSGSAKRTRRGFKVDAVKRIVSGIEGSDLLATSAIYDDPVAGATVLHFLVPLPAAEMTIERSWRAMGMRGTGSHNAIIRSLIVPGGHVIARRPQGVWHQLYHAAILLAMPLIYSVYLGIAEAAREQVLARCIGISDGKADPGRLGEMEAELNAARMAVKDMLAAAEGEASPESTSRVFMARGMAASRSIAVVEMALELLGPEGFMQGHPLERMFRDVQGARFHPGASLAQRDFSGRLALSRP